MFYSYGCNFATACFCRKSFKIAVEAVAGVVFCQAAALAVDNQS